LRVWVIRGVLGLKVLGLSFGFRVWDLGFWIHGFGFRMWGVGFHV
jgi:hypothetical protein